MFQYGHMDNGPFIWWHSGWHSCPDINYDSEFRYNTTGNIKTSTWYKYTNPYSTSALFDSQMRTKLYWPCAISSWCGGCQCWHCCCHRDSLPSTVRRLFSVHMMRQVSGLCLVTLINWEVFLIGWIDTGHSQPIPSILLTSPSPSRKYQVQAQPKVKRHKWKLTNGLF